MIIRIFSRPVFLFQLNLNNTDGVVTIRRTPITMISIDKIINTFIFFIIFFLLFFPWQQFWHFFLNESMAELWRSESEFLKIYLAYLRSVVSYFLNLVQFLICNQSCGPLMPYQSIAINTMKLIPTNNQKIGVNNSFLMPNRIVINTKELIPTNIQKTVINVTAF